MIITQNKAAALLCHQLVVSVIPVSVCLPVCRGGICLLKYFLRQTNGAENTRAAGPAIQFDGYNEWCLGQSVISRQRCLTARQQFELAAVP